MGKRDSDRDSMEDDEALRAAGEGVLTEVAHCFSKSNVCILRTHGCIPHSRPKFMFVLPLSQRGLQFPSDVDQ